MERKNIYIVIFVITTIIASCVAVYFAVNSNNQITELEEKIDKLTTQNSTSTNDVESEEEIDTSSNNDILYRNSGDIQAKVQNGKAYVKITNSPKIEANVIWKKELDKYYEIENVNGNVVDVAIYTAIGSGSKIFVLLMDDGTIQKTKLSDGNGFVSNGKIDGYENIVSIDRVEILKDSEYIVDTITVTDETGNTTTLENLI